VLAELGRERGFKVVVATRGADALAPRASSSPTRSRSTSGLPDLDGWRVLDRLKDDPETRHIPLFLISAADELERSLRRRRRRLPAQAGGPRAARQRVRRGCASRPSVRSRGCCSWSRRGAPQPDRWSCSASAEVETTWSRQRAAAHRGARARARSTAWCLGLQGEAAARWSCCSTCASSRRSDRADRAVYDESPPGRARRRAAPLRAGAGAEVRALDGPAVDETTLLPAPRRVAAARGAAPIVERLHSADVLSGRTVLIVDDDVRNIFAMTSLLERHGMQVVTAENGQRGARALSTSTRESRSVLMDIMLPEMDGYETTRIIRKMPAKRDLPILA
jgi:CheY-like chemotaxis protein